MQLVTYPCILNAVFFFQLIDNALADIAEGSDVIGKYSKDDHIYSSQDPSPRDPPHSLFIKKGLRNYA